MRISGNNIFLHVGGNAEVKDLDETCSLVMCSDGPSDFKSTIFVEAIDIPDNHRKRAKILAAVIINDLDSIPMILKGKR